MKKIENRGFQFMMNFSLINLKENSYYNSRNGGLSRTKGKLKKRICSWERERIYPSGQPQKPYC